MKMELKEKLPLFKDWINVIRTIGEEQSIEARNDGLHVVGMDPSHVAMINAEFQKELFDSYEVEEDDNVTINVNELYKRLNRIEKNERVTLEKDVKQAKFLITVQKGTRIRRFKMNILADEAAEVPEPKIFFKGKVRITHDDFHMALNDAQLVSEHIVVIMEKDVMKIEGYGDEGDTLAQWDENSDDILSLKIDEDGKATYTLSYLMEIVKAIKGLSEVLEVEISTDMPIRIKAECVDHIKLEFFLAPCIGV